MTIRLDIAVSFLSFVTLQFNLFIPDDNVRIEGQVMRILSSH